MVQKSKNIHSEKARKAGKEAAEGIKKIHQETEEVTQKAKQKVKSTAHEVNEKAGDKVTSAKEKVKDISEAAANAGFWEDVQENISEGAKVLNEEAKEFAEKVGSYSERIFGAIREKAADALNYGTNLTKDAVNYAQTLAEKYRDQAEISKLNEEKKKASSQLGMNIYLAYKNNDNRVPVQTFRQKKIKSLLKELEELDKKILDLTEGKK